MHLKNVTLELSGKPFTDESEERMVSVCRTMFSQWKPLTEKADLVSVLLWIADGSEILEYTGDMSRKFEWSYWCGCANPCPRPEHPTEREKRNTHAFPQKYIPEAGPRPYSWLKRLIEVIREIGREITGKPIRIGATVAVADFEGYVTMFNPATGEIVGRTSLDSAVTTPASQYGYGAVFQTVDGEVAYVVQEQLAE